MRDDPEDRVLIATRRKPKGTGIEDVVVVSALYVADRDAAWDDMIARLRRWGGSCLKWRHEFRHSIYPLFADC